MEGAAAVDIRAVYSNPQPKPCGEGQSKNPYPLLYNPEHLINDMADILYLFSVYLNLQRINDSLMICAEPDDFTMSEFIAVGLVP